MGEIMLILNDVVLIAIGTNKNYVPNINTLNFITKQIKFNDIIIFSNLNFYENYNHIFIESVCNSIDYSGFVLYELYDLLINYGITKDKHILIVQPDGFPVNINKWTNEFLNYDYIGAPWHFFNWFLKDIKILPPKVGNGGFSLRSMKLMKLCKTLSSCFTLKNNRYIINDKNIELKKDIYKNYIKYNWNINKAVEIHNEDIIISILNRNIIESNGFTFAPLELADRFSCESGNHFDKSFGFHSKNTNINISKNAYQVYMQNIKYLNI
jgi:hypothetical protein